MFVSAEGVVCLHVGAVARSVEPGSVSSGDAENIEPVGTAPRRAAGIKVGDMPGQGRVGRSHCVMVIGGSCQGHVEDRQERDQQECSQLHVDVGDLDMKL